MPDFYNTILKEHRAEIKVKSSVFIATAIPITAQEMAIEKWKAVKAEFHDANHNCFAYILGANKEEFRYSDDGEPSGSAGKPIHFIIEKYDLSDIIVIVTRYFGGTKLGIGGLVRAYSDATEEVLKNIQTKLVHLTKTIKVMCSYSDISFIKRLIDEKAVSFKELYDENVTFWIDIHQSKAQDFADYIYTQSNANIKVSIIN